MKKFKETEKIGIYIFLINIMLILYTFTEGGDEVVNLIVALSSTFVAIIFNIHFIKTTKKSIINIIFMILNVIIFNILVFFKLLSII